MQRTSVQFCAVVTFALSISAILFIDESAYDNLNGFISTKLQCANCTVSDFVKQSLASFNRKSSNSSSVMIQSNINIETETETFNSEKLNTIKNNQTNTLNTTFINTTTISTSGTAQLFKSGTTPHSIPQAIPESLGAPFDQIDRNSSISVTLQYGIANVSQKQCGPGKTLIVVVIGEPQDFEQRAIIRQTWGSDRTEAISVLFHVGQMSSKEKQNEIESRLFQEIANYSDIIVSDVVENYYNLSLKTYGSLLFLAEYCKSATCAIKTDMDTVLNLPALERLCKESQPMTFRGACWKGGQPDRAPKSKWFVPVWVWKDNYPDFCSGSAYMIVGEGAPAKLLEAAHDTRFHRSNNFRKFGEDVIWTGFAAQKANIPRVFTLGFSPSTALNYFYFNGSSTGTSFSVHYLKSREQITGVWRQMRPP